jgi:hypothetical protein
VIKLKKKDSSENITFKKYFQKKKNLNQKNKPLKILEE